MRDRHGALDVLRFLSRSARLATTDTTACRQREDNPLVSALRGYFHPDFWVLIN